MKLSFKIKYKIFKRIADILFSIIILALLSPALLIIVFIILITSKGLIFFNHPRLGENGKLFKCIKFRTMYEGSQEKLAEILNENKELQKEFETNFKLRKDPRITPFGKFLRKTSIDELPQFLNVIKGEMSIIGPRPIVPHEKDRYQSDLNLLLSVKPGITGLWQVKGRSKTTYGTRKDLDLSYVRKFGLKLDLKIFFKTFYVLLRPFDRGAY